MPPHRPRANRSRAGDRLTKMAAALPASWEELPQELLGLVLLRLPSLADRVRLRAVCHPWLAGAQPQQQKQLAPPLPWLALRDGSLVDLAGAPVRCPSILRDGVFGYLAVDNLAFLVHHDGSCSLMNPLSGFMLHLPELAPATRRAIEKTGGSHLQKAHAKAIMSSPVESTPHPLIAVLILAGFSIAIFSCKRHEAIDIAMSPGTIPDLPRKLYDIAFFNGKLCTITGNQGALCHRASIMLVASGCHQELSMHC